MFKAHTFIVVLAVLISGVHSVAQDSPRNLNLNSCQSLSDVRSFGSQTPVAELCAPHIELRATHESLRLSLNDEANNWETVFSNSAGTCTLSFSEVWAAERMQEFSTLKKLK